MNPQYRQPYRPVESHTLQLIAAVPGTVPVGSKNSEIGITPVISALLDFIISAILIEKQHRVSLKTAVKLRYVAIGISWASTVTSLVLGATATGKRHVSQIVLICQCFCLAAFHLIYVQIHRVNRVSESPPGKSQEAKGFLRISGTYPP